VDIGGGYPTGRPSPPRSMTRSRTRADPQPRSRARESDLGARLTPMPSGRAALDPPPHVARPGPTCSRPQPGRPAGDQGVGGEGDHRGAGGAGRAA